MRRKCQSPLRAQNQNNKSCLGAPHIRVRIQGHTHELSRERLSLLDEELRQLMEILRGHIGDGAKLHALMAPVNPLIALPGAGRMNRRVRFLGRPYKNVDEMFSSPVDERSDIAFAENIQAAAKQWKTFVHEIVH